jgi:hypothetical protein
MKNLYFRWLVTALAFSICMAPLHATGTETPGPDVEKQYRSCPNGAYSGPRPGRIRYTKDLWLWVVTPEFAKKFCMPEEFVSMELKGVEAVAFRIDEKRDEQSCGWGGRVDVCNTPKYLRFELYIKSSVKLPKLRDIPYSHAADIPSRYMIDQSEKEGQASLRLVKTNPHIGAMGIFEASQIGLMGVKNDKVIWPITGLYADIFYGEIFEGVDLISFQGLTGFFTNPRMEKQNIRKFVIAFDRLGDKRPSNADRPLSEFAYFIELPEAFTDKIRAIDKANGFTAEEFGKRAMGVLPPK